jgi:hypothetical protein
VGEKALAGFESGSGMGEGRRNGRRQRKKRIR